MKRHKHACGVLSNNVPKANKEAVLNDDGKVIGVRKVDHVRSNLVYHPTKGWRKIRQYSPHQLLAHLFANISINIYQPQ